MNQNDHFDGKKLGELFRKFDRGIESPGMSVRTQLMVYAGIVALLVFFWSSIQRPAERPAPQPRQQKTVQALTAPVPAAPPAPTVIVSRPNKVESKVPERVADVLVPAAIMEQSVSVEEMVKIRISFAKWGFQIGGFPKADFGAKKMLQSMTADSKLFLCKAETELGFKRYYAGQWQRRTDPAFARHLPATRVSLQSLLQYRILNCS